MKPRERCEGCGLALYRGIGNYCSTCGHPAPARPSGGSLGNTDVSQLPPVGQATPRPGTVPGRGSNHPKKG
jgi:hypothetical protein